MWLACYTQKEIAEKENTKQETVRDILAKKAELPESLKPAANHQTDFTPPIYSVWKVQNKSNTTNHFGNSEAARVDNLLYLYTNPFDIVVDPFAGGGSTIDVCKKRFRRYVSPPRARGETCGSSLLPQDSALAFHPPLFFSIPCNKTPACRSQ